MHLHHIRFKGELRAKLHPCFHVRLLLIVWSKSSVQSFVAISADFMQISQSYKVRKICILRMWCHTREYIKHVTPGFLCIFYFYEKKTPPIIKFYGVFNHFYELVKSLTIKLYHWVSDVIRTNEQTKYVTCDLNVNFWNFLQMPFCFMTKKDHFKQKFLLWPQVPLNLDQVCRSN